MWVELRPGAPYYFPAPFMSGLDGTAPATVAGSGAVWADDSDATHVTIDEWDNGGTGEYSTTASADFPPLPAGKILNMQVAFRGQYLQGVVQSARLTVALSDPADSTGVTTLDVSGDDGNLIASSPNWTDPENWWIYDAAGDISYWPSGGIRFSVWSNFPEHADPTPFFRLHEVKMLVEVEGATGLPPLRQDLCRDDHRVWPVSSQQASLRRLGGYY